MNSTTKTVIKRITKHYSYLRQAELYQTRLHNRFNYVRLVAWPRFTNQGNYTWEVKSTLESTHQ